MNAVYILIDDATLDSWMDLDEKSLLRALSDLEETEETEQISLAKNWDIVHYYLTGISASMPIEGDKLSEAVVGVHNFSYNEDAAFITCTEYDELPEIIEALKSFDLGGSRAKLDRMLMKKANLYPNNIEEDDLDDLYKGIGSELKSLIAFYEYAVNSKKHVIVSIL